MTTALSMHAKAACEARRLRTGTHPENVAALRLDQWGHRPEPQYSVGRYRLDFAFPALRIAVEIDGPHHQRPDVAVRDTFRDQWLRDHGWIVFRVNAGDTLEEQLSRVSRFIHCVARGGDA